MDAVSFLLTGVAIWYATGLDDLLVLTALLLDSNHRTTIEVTFGTLLGVCIMFGLCVTFRGAVVNTSLVEWTHLAGAVPIFLGLKTFKEALKKQKADEDDNEDKTRFGWFFSAMSIYLANSTDDISVVTSIIVNEATLGMTMIWSGIMTGAITSILLARMLSKILSDYSKQLQLVAGGFLLLIGTHILTGGLLK